MNGAMVALAKVPSLVITLGTLYVIRGIDYAWAQGRQINAADMPDSFLDLGTARIAGFPVLPLITIAVMILVGIVLGRAAHGPRAVRDRLQPRRRGAGRHPHPAPRARRVHRLAARSRAWPACSGPPATGRWTPPRAPASNSSRSSAVVVGGVAIFGGSGTVYGAALGALLLATIRSSLVNLQVNPFWEQAINGALLLIAIGLDRLLALRMARELRKRASHRV